MSTKDESRGRGAEDEDAVADFQVVARGTRYSALAQAGTQGLRFATNVVLARLLTPHDFGVVAIALVVTMVLDQLKDMGTGSALIQRKRVDHLLINSVFYLNLALGAVLAVGLVVLAEPLASLLGNPEAAPVLKAFAAVTFLTALGQIHHALLRRDLRFFELAVVMTVGALATGVVAIAGAVAGYGVWALVLGTAAGAVASTALVWVYDSWRPTLALSLESLASIWRYSFHLFLSNLLFIGFSQVDKLIISHFLGAGPLGSYTLAQRTVSAPVAAVGSAVGEVAFPAFSRRQDDNVALRSGFVRSSRVIALVTFPATVGLAILAAPFVSVVFGSQWDAVAPVVSVLAPIAAIQSVTFNSSQLLLAKGRSDWSYRWGMVYCVVLTVFELVGVKWGLFGTAVGFAVGVATLTPFSLMLAFHQVEMRLRDYLVALWPQFWITTVMAGFVGLALVVARAAAWGDLAALVAGTTAGVVVYGVLLLVVRPAALEDAMAALPRRRLR